MGGGGGGDCVGGPLYRDHTAAHLISSHGMTRIFRMHVHGYIYTPHEGLNLAN